jgi:hypothetical protein
VRKSALIGKLGFRLVTGRSELPLSAMAQRGVGEGSVQPRAAACGAAAPGLVTARCVFEGV